MLLLEPTPFARELADKKVEVVNYPDGRFAIRHKGVALPFRLFDKIQTVVPGAIVENKRALVDRSGVGEDQFVQLREAVDHLPTVEIDRELTLLHVYARHDAEVAVVDFLAGIVLGLRGLVSRRAPARHPFASCPLSRRCVWLGPSS
jgi:hypothetical protein